MTERHLLGGWDEKKKKEGGKNKIKKKEVIHSWYISHASH